MSTVLVTGAGGYIGNVLCRELMKEGFNVVAVDKFLFGIDLLGDYPQLKKVVCDIRDINLEWAKFHLQDIDAIIDLAAISNDPAGEFFAKETDEINWHGRVGLAHLAKLMGVPRYILPSSCSIYGSNDNLVNEKSHINPLTTYAKANGKAEEEILPLADSNFCVTVIRQATIFGWSPRMRLDLAVNIMTYEAVKNHKIIIHGDGLQWRPFLHVKDTSKAMCHILKSQKKAINGQIFNVGCENITIKDLAERIVQTLDHIKIGIEYQGYTDARNYNVDFSKINRELKWFPTYGITHGIQEIYVKINDIEGNNKNITLKWYQDLENWNKTINEICGTYNTILKR